MVKRSHTSSQNLLHPFFFFFNLYVLRCSNVYFFYLFPLPTHTFLKEHFRHLCFYIIKIMCLSRVLKSSVRRLVSVLSVFSLLPSLGAVSTGVVVLVLSRR